MRMAVTLQPGCASVSAPFISNLLAASARCDVGRLVTLRLPHSVLTAMNQLADMHFASTFCDFHRVSTYLLNLVICRHGLCKLDIS